MIWSDSPVDLSITDKQGLVINKQGSQMVNASYEEIDIDDDDEIEDIVILPSASLGDYSITVIPEFGALPTDTYSLRAETSDTSVPLEENVQIQNIPSEPYHFTYELTTPRPLPGFTNPPTDPDHDSLYEDLNANNRKDFNDVVLIFNQMQWIAANEPVNAFDFNGNARIDFNDIVKLFGEI